RRATLGVYDHAAPLRVHPVHVPHRNLGLEVRREHAAQRELPAKLVQPQQLAALSAQPRSMLHHREPLPSAQQPHELADGVVIVQVREDGGLVGHRSSEVGCGYDRGVREGSLDGDDSVPSRLERSRRKPRWIQRVVVADVPAA
ncbi:unnamed protein product, partial [Ectocarpus sp. 13 AM-2016]